MGKYDDKTIDITVPQSVKNQTAALYLTEENMKELKRGEIYYIHLSPVIGSEQGGRRPAVIIQNNIGNKHSRTTIIAPITSIVKRNHMPTHVIIDIDCLDEISIVLLEQIRTVDISRLDGYLGTVNTEVMKKINRAMSISLGLDNLEGLRNE